MYIIMFMISKTFQSITHKSLFPTFQFLVCKPLLVFANFIGTCSITVHLIGLPITYIHIYKDLYSAGIRLVTLKSAHWAWSWQLMVFTVSYSEHMGLQMFFEGWQFLLWSQMNWQFVPQRGSSSFKCPITVHDFVHVDGTCRRDWSPDRRAVVGWYRCSSSAR